MINPNDIVEALVLLLRDIPDLVAAVGGDEERIFSYYDQYPKDVSLELARYQMLAPGIMVAWQGSGPGSFGNFEVWKHDISLTLRAAEDSGEETPSGYYRLFQQIVKGKPKSLGQAMQYVTVHSACQPMDTPRMQRQTDSAGVDYFEVSMTFTESGDD